MRPGSSNPVRQRVKPPWYQSGFTLLEVMIAVGVAVLVISGLAAATLSITRTNVAASELGEPERALHQALEEISSNLRTNNGEGQYACGRTGTLANGRSLPVTTPSGNSYDVEWRTRRVNLGSDGGMNPVACGSIDDQGTLLVDARLQDDGVRHERELLVNLNRGARPLIRSFTADQAHVRPNTPVELSWQLEDNPPAGTITLLDGERVETTPEPDLNGSATVRPQETTTYTLDADSSFGSDTRTVTVE